ncbi:MAG: hypothetical protein R6U98_32170, partial [Pirellulaceae bacterium]
LRRAAFQPEKSNRLKYNTGLVHRDASLEPLRRVRGFASRSLPYPRVHRGARLIAWRDLPSKPGTFGQQKTPDASRG